MSYEFIEDFQAEYERTYRLWLALLQKQEQVVSDLNQCEHDESGWRELHEAELHRLADEIAEVGAELRSLEVQCP